MSLMMAESVSASVPSKSKISQGGDGWEETGVGNVNVAGPVDMLSYPRVILRPAGGQVNPDASAADYGFKVVVPHEACATRDLKFEAATVPAAQVHAAALAAMNGTYARVIKTETLIAELR
jgi:hypothetical protein